MKAFKSVAEVEASGLPPPLYKVVHQVMRGLVEAYEDELGVPYSADDYGYVILVEGAEPDSEIEAEVGYNLKDAMYEGGSTQDGCFVTCTLHNNCWGISWIVVDSPALDREVRAKLVEACCEEAQR